MLGLGTEHIYYFYLSPVDMRKGFNGLTRKIHKKNSKLGVK